MTTLSEETALAYWQDQYIALERAVPASSDRGRRGHFGTSDGSAWG